MQTIDFVKKSTTDTFVEIEKKIKENRTHYTEIKILVKAAKELISVLSPSVTFEQRMEHSDFFNATTNKLKKVEKDLQNSIAESLSQKDYKAHFSLINTYKDIADLKKQLYVPMVFKGFGEQRF